MWCGFEMNEIEIKIAENEALKKHLRNQIAAIQFKKWITQIQIILNTLKLYFLQFVYGK